MTDTDRDLIPLFERIDVAEAVLQRLDLDLRNASCTLEIGEFGVAEVSGATRRFAPGQIVFLGVLELGFEGQRFQLNNTIIATQAVRRPGGGAIDFFIELTGGTDPEAFFTRLRITARDLRFRGFEHGPK